MGNLRSCCLSFQCLSVSNSKGDVKFHHIAHDYSCCLCLFLLLFWSIAYISLFCRWYQQNKFSESKVKFRQAIAKGFLKLPKLHILIEQKSLSLPRNFALGTFGELLIVFSTNLNLHYLLYSMARSCCPSASDKAKLFARNFSRNSVFVNAGISLPVFPCRTNLKSHDISVTPNLVKKVITNLNLSKASGPDLCRFHTY